MAIVYNPKESLTEGVAFGTMLVVLLSVLANALPASALFMIAGGLTSAMAALMLCRSFSTGIGH